MCSRVFLLLVSMAFASPLFAQELEETLSRVGDAYAEAYLKPFNDAIGANLNSGLYFDAGVGGSPVGVDLFLGVEAFGAFLSDADQSFDLVFSGRVDIDRRVAGELHTFSVPATFEVQDAPTVFGDETPAVATVTAVHDTTVTRLGIAVPVSFDTTFTEEIIGGVLQTNIVPAAIPQLRIGSVLGTDIMVRWVPRIDVTDVGTVGMFGMGVRHSLSQYIPLSPVSVAVQVAWQHLGVDDLEEQDLLGASTFAAGIAVSHELGMLTLFGGLQTERSTLDVSYQLETESEEVGPVPVSFRAVGASRGRGTAGAGLRMGPVRLHGSYSIGRVNVVRFGFGFAY